MSNDRKIGKFCQYILDTLCFVKPSREEEPTNIVDLNQANLKEFFLKWVVISYIDDKENQEKQINTLFTELRSMGIDSDP
jgi:hypothetical protein